MPSAAIDVEPLVLFVSIHGAVLRQTAQRGVYAIDGLMLSHHRSLPSTENMEML